MLSIQVHPTKEYAKVAFEKEEAAGIALNAPNRNYKDTNHKPEIMLAMSEFWLLHGFKSEAKILETLENIAEFQVLVPLYKTEGLKGLYQFLMEMEQAQVDSLLSPVVKEPLGTNRRVKWTEAPQIGGWLNCMKTRQVYYLLTKAFFRYTYLILFV